MSVKETERPPHTKKNPLSDTEKAPSNGMLFRIERMLQRILGSLEGIQGSMPNNTGTVGDDTVGSGDPPDPPNAEPPSSSGGGGSDDMLEKRVRDLEVGVAEIKTILDHELPAIRQEMTHHTTKADLSEAKSSIIKWNVGTMLTVAAIVVAIMRIFGTGG